MLMDFYTFLFDNIQYLNVTKLEYRSINNNHVRLIEILNCEEVIRLKIQTDF